MNPSWNSFLLSQGASIEDTHVIHFGNFPREIEAVARNTILCDLSHFGIIQFGGDDARSFLQGQLSNDVSKINSALAQYTAYCSPKGRVLANGLLLLSTTGYWLQLPQELIEPVRKRLSMFVLRSKVNTINVSDESVVFGISGENAAVALEREIGTVPLEMHEVQQHDDVMIVKVGAARYEIFLAANRAPELWQRLSQTAQPVGSGCWDWLTIRAGIPVITLATQEQFVPQMINYEIVNGISFEKGCYPGQEIVARTKYLGKLTRRMYLAHIQADTPPHTNDALFSQDMGDQPCGAVVNAALAPGGGVDALVVLLINSASKASIHLNSLVGSKLDLLQLPYSVGEGR